jgi:hypothetical protein
MANLTLLSEIEKRIDEIGSDLKALHNKKNVVQSDIDEALKIFKREEGRAVFYDRSLGLIKNGHKIDAYILFLATWNFARFRYAVNEFELIKFEDMMVEIEEDIGGISPKSFWDIDLEKVEGRILKSFIRLDGVKGIEHTGAAKMLHLLVPDLFIIWDGFIRNFYGFKSKKDTKKVAKDYFEFLVEMKEKFNHNKITPKQIDEYNYANITLPNLKMNKLKKLRRELRQTNDEYKKEKINEKFMEIIPA